MPARDKPWDCVNVVCLDDDARGSAAWKQANRAIRAARAAGHVVLIVNTWQVRRGDNFAEILAARGERRRALDTLAPVYRWFTEGFDTTDLRKARGLHDTLM